MKILLTQAISNFIPVRNGFYSPHIGILSIAAYLEKFGFEVKVIEPWILKMNWKEMLEFIKNKNPHVVGITSLTCNAYHAMALTGLIKQINPNIIVVMGGHHFSFTPEESLRICDDIDYIVIGEGEETFLELLKFISEGRDKEGAKQINGLAFMLGKQFIRTPCGSFIENLDELPCPAYHLLPSLDKIKIPLARRGALGCTFSRGCNQACTFCSETLLWRGKRRTRSARKIVDEIELLVKKYKKNEFSFGDTDFLYSRKRNLEFLEELSNRNLKIKFRIATRADSIIKNRDLLKEMRRLGLIFIAVGIESFSQKNLNNWNKEITLEQIDLMAKYINDAKIPIFEGLMMMSGSNEDYKKMVRKILKKSAKIKINILWCSILTAFPGTPLYKEAIRNDRIRVWDYRRYDFYHAIMPTKNASIKTLEVFNVMIYLLWFYNPIRFFKNLFNEDSRKFQLFQLCFDFRIILRFMHSNINNLFGINNRKYKSLIEDFYYKHLIFLDKRLKPPKTIKIWSH